jgi:hypothetical protein
MDGPGSRPWPLEELRQWKNVHFPWAKSVFLGYINSEELKYVLLKPSQFKTYVYYITYIYIHIIIYIHYICNSGCWFWVPSHSLEARLALSRLSQAQCWSSLQQANTFDVELHWN